ncbi:glycosyltransferase family 31 protein [Zasmidium cellare ATCC 36951]|uniref:N-acetylgalactosaminide beta-1,3-galactosyltransferase n=1 Tax=Zasmidium cellare ATCC 36951 TaxID=1080233 RepID=A0A6A6C203_ZASCE|nr:glycosyltransferase family 31 protein [Zasmidium cellare ATCC 36951]KAF2160328.1 glycosyltransferase family 31 protein [Zasmidium cellare ATCC 36951]
MHEQHVLCTSALMFKVSRYEMRIWGVCKTKAFFPPLKDGCPHDHIPPGPTTLEFPAALLGDVQIVMKTGIGERAKTETFLETYGSVVGNVLIFSDAEDRVGGYEVVDILAELPPSYAVNNSDWAYYVEQQEALKAGETVGKSHEGWRIDRFKFLPMVEKAFELRPHAKWYVFIEADIYYFWDTLFRMLDNLDPNTAHYLGAPTPGAHDRWFAYGGGGTVLSNRLVKDLLQNGKKKVSRDPKYEFWAKDDCCGDAVLAYVIHAELGIRLESMYPTFSGEMVQWLQTPREKWCVPLLGLHRVSQEQMKQLWKWERCRAYTETPVTYATILDVTLTPLLKENPSRDWNNGANHKLPEEDLAHEGIRFCEIACADNSTCLQYRYSRGRCYLSDFVQAGDKEEDLSKEAFSGWGVEALERLGYDPDKDPSTYCSEAQWVIPKGT